MRELTVAEIDRLVESRREDIIKHVVELLRRRPTYLGDGSGIASAQAYLRECIGELGATIVPINHPSDLRANSLYVGVEEWSEEFAAYEPGSHPILVGRWEVDPAMPTLALAGHIDVEPHDEHEWSNPEWAGGHVAEGRIFGRGSSDMLCAFAAYLVAIDIVRRLGNLRCNLELHSVPDEELGGNGTLALLERHRAPDYVLLGEPSGMEVCEATLGFHHFVVEIEGRRAHMASSTQDTSAIELAARVVTALTRVRGTLFEAIKSAPGFNGYTSTPFAIGKIHAGTDAAVPPKACTVEGVVFSGPNMSVSDVRRLLRNALAEADVDHTVLRLTRMSFGGNEPAVDRSLAEAMLSALSETGSDARLNGFPSPCDLRLYRAFGSAGIVCGPGDLAQAHAPDERVRVDRLVAYTRALVHLLTSFSPANLPHVSNQTQEVEYA